ASPACPTAACRSCSSNRWRAAMKPRSVAAARMRPERRLRAGGEGGIRTHVPELPDHPISSRRRYDHFGTSPALAAQASRYSSRSGCTVTSSIASAPAPWAALAVLACLGLAGCSAEPSGLAQLRARGELRVGTVNEPTVYYLGAHGPQGFDYRLARA